MEGSIQAVRRAASLPILLCHGLGTHILLKFLYTTSVICLMNLVLFD